MRFSLSTSNPNPPSTLISLCFYWGEHSVWTYTAQTHHGWPSATFSFHKCGKSCLNFPTTLHILKKNQSHCYCYHIRSWKCWLYLATVLACGINNNFLAFSPSLTSPSRVSDYQLEIHAVCNSYCAMTIKQTEFDWKTARGQTKSTAHLREVAHSVTWHWVLKPEEDNNSLFMKRNFESRLFSVRKQQVSSGQMLMCAN